MRGNALRIMFSALYRSFSPSTYSACSVLSSTSSLRHACESDRRAVARIAIAMPPAGSNAVIKGSRSVLQVSAGDDRRHLRLREMHVDVIVLRLVQGDGYLRRARGSAIRADGERRVRGR